MKRFVVSLILCTVAVTGCSQSGGPTGGDAAGKEAITVALPAPNAVYWAFYVGIEKGWFADQGFTPEVVTAQGSAGALQQLASGSVEIAAATPDAVVNAVKGGAKVKMLAACMNQSPLTLVAQKDITSYKQLRGKVLGVSAIKGGEISLVRLLLQQHGLKKSDYKVTVSGTTPAKAAALKSGSVAAAALFSPTDFSLLAGGFSRLGSTSDIDLGKEVPLATYNVTESWAGQGDRAERLRKVLSRANDWLRDPANKQEAVQIFAKVAKQKPKHVAETYDLWFKKLQAWVSGYGSVSDQHIDATLELMRRNDEISGAGPTADELRIQERR